MSAKRDACGAFQPASLRNASWPAVFRHSAARLSVWGREQRVPFRSLPDPVPCRRNRFRARPGHAERLCYGNFKNPVVSLDPRFDVQRRHRTDQNAVSAVVEAMGGKVEIFFDHIFLVGRRGELWLARGAPGFGLKNMHRLLRRQLGSQKLFDEMRQLPKQQETDVIAMCRRPLRTSPRTGVRDGRFCGRGEVGASRPRDFAGRRRLRLPVLQDR